jgi:hypothetical protein
MSGRALYMLGWVLLLSTVGCMIAMDVWPERRHIFGVFAYFFGSGVVLVGAWGGCGK